MQSGLGLKGAALARVAATYGLILLDYQQELKNYFSSLELPQWKKVVFSGAKSGGSSMMAAKSNSELDSKEKTLLDRIGSKLASNLLKARKALSASEGGNEPELQEQEEEDNEDDDNDDWEAEVDLTQELEETPGAAAVRAETQRKEREVWNRLEPVLPPLPQAYATFLHTAHFPLPLALCF
jgi:hypothetical protein